MLTVGCVLVVLCGSVLAGAPRPWAVQGPQAPGRGGLAAGPLPWRRGLVVLLYNLAYFDCTITPGPLALGGHRAGWLALLAAGGRGERLGVHVRNLAGWLFLAAGAVYCVQGLGLLVVGAQDYMARAWSDEYGYTSIAQFLMDVPFATTNWGSIAKTPTGRGVDLKTDAWAWRCCRGSSRERGCGREEPV